MPKCYIPSENRENASIILYTIRGENLNATEKEMCIKHYIVMLVRIDIQRTPQYASNSELVM